MVEWLDARSGEALLEPSGGHGAIARWMPEKAQKTVIEPSANLRSRMALVLDMESTKMLDGTFEELNVVNKFDGIAMNPPFGSGGKTAIDHLAKAATHLRDGGRIVALIPTGPAADKKFDKWFYEGEDQPAKPLQTRTGMQRVYAGDTIGFSGGEFKAVSTGRAPGSSAPSDFVTGENGERAHHGSYWVTPGPRTEKRSMASSLYMLADIKLPQVTFERAGTAVATRIVVLEKHAKDSEALKQTASRMDFSNIDDINVLFDRLESVALPARENVKEQATEPPPAPVRPTIARTQQTATPAAQAAPIEDLISVTTSKGKVLRGIIRADLTKEQAKLIDPHTWIPTGDNGEKLDGYFIRKKYLTENGNANPDNRSGTKFSRTGQDNTKFATMTGQEAKYDSTENTEKVNRLSAIVAKALDTSEPDGRSAYVPFSVPSGGDLGTVAAAFGKTITGYRLAPVLRGTKSPFSTIGGVRTGAIPNTVFINQENDRPHLSVLGHELAHELRRDAPDIYNELIEAIRPFINQATYKSEFRKEKVAIDLARRGNIDGVREEFIGEVISDGFTEPEFWNALGAKSPTLLNRVIGALGNLIDKVRRTFGPQRRVNKYLTDFNAVMRLAGAAMAQYAERTANMPSDADDKFLRTSERPSLAATQQIARTGKLPKEKIRRTEIQDALITKLTDSTRPFDVWTQDLPDQGAAAEMIAAKNRASGMEAAFNKRVMIDFGKRVSASIGQIVKAGKLNKNPVEFDAALRLAGDWMSATYAPIANQNLLAKDRAALQEALIAVQADDTVANRVAVNRAKDVFIKRQAAIIDPRVIDPVDSKLEIWLAGGYNNATETMRVRLRLNSMNVKLRSPLVPNLVNAQPALRKTQSSSKTGAFAG
jgi:hypothetical protein